MNRMRSHWTMAPQQHAAGYWAEFNGYDQSFGPPLRAFQIAGHVAQTPARALAWLRWRARQAVWQMDEPHAAAAILSWLSDRGRALDAVTYLTCGEMYVHLVSEGSTHYEFSARPVFLSSDASNCAAALAPCDGRPSA
ncbi:hypothetical protein ACFQ7F_44010 [Streptomyces sp. NPDC056486]|uniref:hypothetical protein n=1 Tax=Streptomyces sp. NPDC056486 TaxID=3345835 RepID=UPI00368C78B8